MLASPCRKSVSVLTTTTGFLGVCDKIKHKTDGPHGASDPHLAQSKHGEVVSHECWKLFT